MLEQEYIQELASYGFDPHGRKDTAKIPPNELREVIEHDIIESALRDGASFSTAIGIAKSFSNGIGSAALDATKQMLHNLALRKENAVETQGGSLKKPVYVGEYPCIGINARVKRYASGYVVFIHRELMTALHQAAKIYSWSWSFSDVDEIGIRVSEPAWHPDDTLLALAHLAGEVIQRNATCTPRFRVPGGKRFWVYASTLEAAELFVVAHEYAHILNADFADDESPIAWIENAADSLAWSLVFAGIDRSGNTVGERDEAKARIAGILLLFGLRRLVQQVREQIFTTKPDQSVPELERIEKFRMFLERHADPELMEHFESCFNWWSFATDLILEKCNWSEANPVPSYPV